MIREYPSTFYFSVKIKGNETSRNDFSSRRASDQLPTTKAFHYSSDIHPDGPHGARHDAEDRAPSQGLLVRDPRAISHEMATAVKEAA